MSDDLTFDDLLHYLQRDSDPQNRAEAARILGDFVQELDQDEYRRARSVLNAALADPDPMVIMAVMNALTAYNREGRHIKGKDFEVHGDSPDDLGVAPPEQAACKVCARPEALIPDGGCERKDCPYKS